jgi:phage major head subunit gpT-like protein
MEQPSRPPSSSKLRTREAAFTPSSFDAEKRTVGVTFSTGAPRTLRDFEGPFIERLSMEPKAVNLSQLSGAPVLNSHDRFDVRSILGTVETPAVDGTAGVATLRFSSRPEVQGIVQDIGAGIIRNVSVGYSVQRWEVSKAADGTRTKTAVRWTPAEISLTAIPADPYAKMRTAEDDDGDCDCPEGEECECDESEDSMTKSATVPDQIRSAAALLGITGDFPEQLATREGITIEAARPELLAHLQQQTPRIDGRTSVTITRDGHDGFMDRALNAVAHRIAPGRIKLEDGAQVWVGRRLADIGREFCRMAGVSTLGSDDAIFQRWGSLHTTSDFGNFLAELFNKQLLPRFLMAPSGLKEVTRRSTANDFRLKHVYRNSPMGQLQPLGQHGEFQRTTKADAKAESYAVQSFAAVFGISRQTLTNDDLGVFSDIGASLAQQSAEFENQQLANQLVSNPLMSDGNALFSAAHGNLAATPGAIATQTLSDARLAMRLQVNQNNQAINIRPTVLLTSATNETAAQAALAEIYPTQVNYVNVFTDFVRLVIDPRLDLLGQTKGWYLFADTGYAPVLEDSYLSGYEGPRVFTRVGFQGGSDIDGTEVLCQLDYGVGAIGWQGGYYNAGA